MIITQTFKYIDVNWLSSLFKGTGKFNMMEVLMKES